MADQQQLPPFDVTAKCIKCGNQIPDPVAPAPKMAKGPDGVATPLPAGPPPPRQPPDVWYCDGEQCPNGEPDQSYAEHMHQTCEICGFEWLSAPLA